MERALYFLLYIVALPQYNIISKLTHSNMANSAYTHTTSPKPLLSKMKKTTYRAEDEENIITNNIMFDRRVVRGNTYAAQVVTHNTKREVERMRYESERTLRRDATCQRKERLAGKHPSARRRESSHQSSNRHFPRRTV